MTKYSMEFTGRASSSKKIEKVDYSKSGSSDNKSTSDVSDAFDQLFNS